MDIDYTLVDDTKSLEEFERATRGLTWLAFDTEFIGEKRYQTLLCLIQVACEAGIYLLDPLRLPDIDPLLTLIEDPKVRKITHAGDNDYRLLYSLYGTVPKNVFDTQVSGGFVGYRYPTSFSKLVEAELGIRLKKGYAVTDWEQRPFRTKQLTYALEDVTPLYDLYQSLMKKLEDVNRADWAMEECAIWTSEDYYIRSPYHEALNSKLIQNLKSREQIFLIRLLEWRRSRAEEKNYSKEMILPTKVISQIVKSVRSGRDALTENRRIPGNTVKRYADLFVRLYEEPATEEERAVLKKIPRHVSETEREDMLMELLYLLMKYRSQEENISHQLVMPRNAIRKMKDDPEVRQLMLGDGWRRELLGEQFSSWLEDFDRLQVKINGGKIEIGL